MREHAGMEHGLDGWRRASAQSSQFIVNKRGPMCTQEEPMFCLYVLFNSARFVADRCAIIRCSHWSVSASFDCNVTYSTRRTKGEHVLALPQRQAKMMQEGLPG
eukprot:COSAG02_NODE_2504_length_8663_cov_3.628211_8_plen_104_part_00